MGTTTSGDAQATQQFSFGPQNSNHSTHSQQSIGGEVTPIIATDLIRVDTSNSNQSEGKAPPARVSTILSSGLNHSAGDVTAFTAPPPAYVADDQKSEHSHPSTRRVSGAGEAGHHERVETIFSNPSGVPAFGDALSTHSQNSANGPVVSPLPAQGFLHQHTMFQGVDAPRAPQAEEGSVVWRSGNYYQVENDGQSLTQIGGKPARMEALVLSQEDMEHMLRADRTTDYPHRTNGQTYTFAGVKVRVQ